MASEILIPTKFLLSLVHLVFAGILLQTRHENIAMAMEVNVDISSSQYKSANSSIVAGLVMIAITALLQIILMLMGRSLFFYKLNLIQCILYALGGLALFWFGLNKWHYQIVWNIWAIFSLLPCIVEALVLIFLALLSKKNDI